MCPRICVWNLNFAVLKNVWAAIAALCAAVAEDCRPRVRSTTCALARSRDIICARRRKKTVQPALLRTVNLDEISASQPRNKRPISQVHRGLAGFCISTLICTVVQQQNGPSDAGWKTITRRLSANTKQVASAVSKRENTQASEYPPGQKSKCRPFKISPGRNASIQTLGGVKRIVLDCINSQTRNSIIVRRRQILQRLGQRCRKLPQSAATASAYRPKAIATFSKPAAATTN